MCVSVERLRPGFPAGGVSLGRSEARSVESRVYLMGNDADTGKTVGYSLDRSIQ